MIKILAIDDNNVNLISLKTIINDLFPDSEVFTAMNGPAGIELAISNNPDLILLDILMPEMDGFEVCQLLKQDERVCDIPVVFITSLGSDKENRIKAIEAGAEAFLTKPTDKIELLVQIRAMIKIKAANEQKREEKTKLQNLVDGHTNNLELSQIAVMNLMKELQAENEAYEKTEEALKKSVELFQGLFNVSPDAFILIDPNHPTISWPIVDCNIAACQMNGYLREELIGHSIDVLNEKAGTIEERIAYYEELREKGTIHKEEIHRHKNGHIFTVEVLTSIVILGGKELVLGIDRDITERKRIENALRESQALYQSFVENMPAGVFRKDSEGRYIFVNTVFCQLKGLKADEIIGKTPRELSEYESSKEANKPHEKKFWQHTLAAQGEDHHKSIMQNGNPIEIEEVYHNIHGSSQYLQVVKSPIFSSTGKVIGSQGIQFDITERKLAEIELKESEERYRSFISQVSEGVYRFESDRPMDLNLSIEEQIDFIYDHLFIAECNNSFVKMYGIEDQKNIIGNSHLDFHGGRNNPVNRNSLRRFILNGYTIEGEITEERNAHSQLINISHNSIGVIENNQLVRMWGTQVDITEKMKLDMVQQVLHAISTAALTSIDLTELIKLIHNELGKLIDSTNFYIAFYDEASGMLSTDFDQDEKDQFDSWPAEKSITGYVIRHKKSLLARNHEVMKLIETGEIEPIGTHSAVWLGVPLMLNQKAIGAIVVQSYDNPDAYTEKDKLMLEFISHQISNAIERKRAEKEIKEALLKARESDSLKSAFLANMSHEIRTPLNSIIGFSDLLLDPFFGADQHAEFAGIIKENGNNLLTIISDIMDLSKIEAGQVQVKKQLFSVNQLINDLQKEYSFRAIEKGIELRLDPLMPEEEVFIESDEAKLRQVLINFVSNAIKFTEKGFVEIGIRTTGNFIQFQVKDTGIGISDEYHKQVFERFRQVETANTRKYGGNGLGLPISKGLVELLGGSIWMESEHGKGSTFCFKIPIK